MDAEFLLTRLEKKKKLTSIVYSDLAVLAVSNLLNFIVG